MDPSTQTPSHPCPTTLPQGADKICISEQCQQQNPFVCPQCEQTHEHNGSVLTVRVARIKQIQSSIGQVLEEMERVSSQLLELKVSVEKRIELFLGGYRGRYADLLEVSGELDGYMNNEGRKEFFKTWNKIKDISTIIEEKQTTRRLNSVIQFKQDLSKFILEKKQPKSMDMTEQIVIQQPKQDKDNIKGGQVKIQSPFLQQFSNIFCFLQLNTPKSKNILPQIELLQTESSAQKKIKARLLQMCQQYDKALTMYNQILADDNLNVQITNRKALLLKKCKKYQQAYDQFNILIDLVKNIANTEYYHFQKGEICCELGKYQEAMNQFKLCSKKEMVSQIKLDIAMANLNYKQKKYKQAIELFKKILQNKQLRTEQKITILQKLQQSAKATQDHTLNLYSLTELHKNKPQDLQILFKRARIYHQIKDYSSAVKDYTLALEKVKNIPGLYYNRAVQLIYSGRSQQAIPDLKQAIELDKQFKQAVHLLANTCFELLHKNHNPQITDHLKILASNSYEYSLKFYPNNESIWHNLGILQTQKNTQRAYQCFTKAIELNPRLSASYLGKVKTGILLKQDPSQTMKDLNILIGLGDRTVSTFLIKCVLEEEQGLYPEALQTANLIIKADSQNQLARQAKQRLQLKVELLNKQLQQLQQDEEKVKQKQEKISE